MNPTVVNTPPAVEYRLRSAPLTITLIFILACSVDGVRHLTAQYWYINEMGAIVVAVAYAVACIQLVLGLTTPKMIYLGDEEAKRVRLTPLVLATLYMVVFTVLDILIGRFKRRDILKIVNMVFLVSVNMVYQTRWMHTPMHTLLMPYAPKSAMAPANSAQQQVSPPPVAMLPIYSAPVASPMLASYGRDFKAPLPHQA